jgi:hypothetical protein
MARKAGKRFPRAKTPRDGEVIRGLLRAAGNREELDRWIDEEIQRPPLKPGRHRIVSDKGFLAVFGDWFGMVPRRMRKEFIERVWKSDKERSEDKTLPRAVREAWDPRRHMGGGTVDSIVRRLEKQLPKRTRTRKPMRAKRV